MSSVNLVPIYWQEAGTYRHACQGTRDLYRAAQSGTTLGGLDVPRALALCPAILRQLWESHIVVVSQEQVEALPTIEIERFPDYAQHLRPPFAPTYFSMGGARSRYDTEQPLAGVTVTYIDEVGAVFTVFQALESGGLLPIPIGTENPNRTDFLESHDSLLVTGVERALSVLLLLDGTVGVKLVQAPVSRQVRRNAKRKGLPIAQVIQIGAPRPEPESDGEGGKIEYSHRFERRGYFACITKGPKFKEEKLATWCPKHGAKRCRREFRRATVVGPPNKPFVPKVRQYQAKPGDRIPYPDLR